MQTQVKENALNGQNFYCGIDLHNKTWAVTMETDELCLRTFTQPADKHALVRFFEKNYPGVKIIAGYEAGYFGFELYRFLQDHGIECRVLHAADIPTTHKEKDQKRDPLDSKKIARALKTQGTRSIWVPPVSVQQDRQLLRTRRALSKDQTRIKNRIKAFLQIYDIAYPEAFTDSRKHWSKKFIAWLKRIRLQQDAATESLQVLVRNLEFLRSELSGVTRRIRDLAASEPYRDPYNKLIQITGVGLITAMTLLMEVGDISRFKNTDQFRSFIGLVPSAHCSGEKDYHGRITNRANHHLRNLLIESAWTAARQDLYFLEVYTRYKQRMQGNRAIVRVAAKLANKMYYCLKQNSN